MRIFALNEDFLLQKFHLLNLMITQGGNFHLKVGGAKSSGNAGVSHNSTDFLIAVLSDFTIYD